MANIRLRPRRKAVSGGDITQTDSKGNNKPWYDLFVKYGFSNSAIPMSDPPLSGSYGEILSWVSGDNWIMDQDTTLAIDIWLGKVSLFDHNNSRISDETIAPSKESIIEPKQVVKKRRNLLQKSLDRKRAPEGPTM